MEVDGKPFKHLPIKGLYHGFMPFQAFLKLMCQEALAEARRYRRSPLRRPVYELVSIRKLPCPSEYERKRIEQTPTSFRPSCTNERASCVV